MQDKLSEVMYWTFVAVVTLGVIILISEVLGLVDVAIQMIAELFI